MANIHPPTGRLTASEQVEALPVARIPPFSYPPVRACGAGTCQASAGVRSKPVAKPRFHMAYVNRQRLMAGSAMADALNQENRGFRDSVRRASGQRVVQRARGLESLEAFLALPACTHPPPPAAQAKAASPRTTWLPTSLPCVLLPGSARWRSKRQASLPLSRSRCSASPGQQPKLPRRDPRRVVQAAQRPVAARRGAVPRASSCAGEKA